VAAEMNSQSAEGSDEMCSDNLEFQQYSSFRVYLRTRPRCTITYVHSLTTCFIFWEHQFIRTSRYQNRESGACSVETFPNSWVTTTQTTLLLSSHPLPFSSLVCRISMHICGSMMRVIGRASVSLAYAPFPLSTDQQRYPRHHILGHAAALSTTSVT
jgi:hypothetical protein